MEMEVEQQPDSEEEPLALPWYRNPTQNHPFGLYKKFALEGPDAEALRTVSFFPWGDDSLSTLWGGSLATEENLAKWNGVLDKYRDTIAVGGDTMVYIIWTKRRKHPRRIKIPETPEVKLIHHDTTNVAWALSPNAIDEPLLIISRGSLLWIFNPVRQGLAGYLRGHGGAITSLAVHPAVPNLFCSTSRDHSTRVYDLTLTPHQGRKDRDVNPHWPPGTLPSRAGAPHGLHMNESEGSGIGRCIVVLMGGRSGGHEAAVLNASFHPLYPVIATCGVDRCVKIWHVHPRNSTQITREDKPLFSSSRIHRSRALSVHWVSHDTLLSHCPSAILRDEPNDVENKSTHPVPGEVVVWRWLALDRFFPPKYDDLRAEGLTQGVLRGCASDYQESASFTMMASGSFPDLSLQLISPVVNIYRSPTHDPIALCVIPRGLPFLRHRKEEGEQTQNTASREPVNDDASPPKDSVSLLPPDEKPAQTKVSQDGQPKKYAGTVTLVHVPSLPGRIPSRFPLDRETPTSGEPTPPAQQEPALSGISEWNPGLIERPIPPPITGWALDVPLDEADLVFECDPRRPGHTGGREDDRMQVDESSGAEASGSGPSGDNARRRRGENSQRTESTNKDPIRVRVQNAMMGDNGKLIVVLGTRGRIWIYRMKN
ncbi:hypothetical protein P691DRAFT_800093 [Macrolepiota fuliginosa MF-IS2]|uniref:WD40 repeat-like protein n=1 Tax=Macrolepiota fuliginosa MF-IS2 TaxID=1400762 RepID=A0A9P5XQV8_9AGAR|nr:hypothetical protein P691DRAFT_800093 [Macrolepiota fuliginosa MF-IS2]